MAKYLFYFSIYLIFFSCKGQQNSFPETVNSPTSGSNKIIGGGCDGCELMFFEMPKNITSQHISKGWDKGKQKLHLTGKVLKNDGRTPASDVIVYYWHTNDKGLYDKGNDATSSTVHGELRGWVKTGQDGSYSIKTSRPAPYPSMDNPQHIHLSIKEPNIANEYYADLFFDDDALYLPFMKKNGRSDRAGTELLRILLDKDVQVVDHNIILGLNIPNYPVTAATEKNSGLEIGEDQPSFIPFHAYGPDKGTKTCPVCKYGRYHGIVYFVGNHPNWEEIKKWVVFLEAESKSRSKYLKAYFVYGNTSSYEKNSRLKELEKIGIDLSLKNIALTFVPSFNDEESESILNEINPEVENTFIIYRHRTIVDKYIDLKPTKENFDLIADILNKTKGNYFDLNEPKHD